ncbi:MAG: chlorophyll synthase ChlG [Herpetosiphonaceae bacterium]|nr:chlorophyll synthase ChlG [Herpetosiphonaceae bacterium]
MPKPVAATLPIPTTGASWRKSLALMKPVTWFAPSWAFLCGAIASGAAHWSVASVGRIALGMLMSGPIVCGLSQVINDYCDRDVDAINEPQRLIPSGQVSTHQIFVTIGCLTLATLLCAIVLGRDVVLFTALGLLLAVVYSAHPVRLKRNGWAGNASVAIAYEGLAWLAGHSSVASLTQASLVVAMLYSLGAHGIMTINDFKSVAGDRRMGIKTIPVLYGERSAAWQAIGLMNLAQLLVIMLFVYRGQWQIAMIIGALLVVQLPLQRIFLRDPRAKAIFYNASGTSFFVWGMLAAAIGLAIKS